MAALPEKRLAKTGFLLIDFLPLNQKIVDPLFDGSVIGRESVGLPFAGGTNGMTGLAGHPEGRCHAVR